MMGFNPIVISPGSVPAVEQDSGEIWTPIYQSYCSFPPEIFVFVMRNLIKNPNINSSYLFRADISVDCPYTADYDITLGYPARIMQFKSFELKYIMVRTMIPRNILVDKPLDQTCLFYEQLTTTGDFLSLVVYLPHISSASESPYYHPAVCGIGFLHTYSRGINEGAVSIYYSLFDSEPRSSRLERTAYHLLAVLYKHGQGTAAGYIKRVHHDVIIPQATVQTTYAHLKAKYSRRLIEGWVETTDPGKHVFEDLNIAAFLIELWHQMYKNNDFPGFCDIGCGNGLLVHILNEEGYSGWGFDARKRKSWAHYSQSTRSKLKEMILVPLMIRSINVPASTASSILPEPDVSAASYIESSAYHTENQSTVTSPQEKSDVGERIAIHDGIFPKGVFIISNHADELTPWTPLLATISECPFMIIPCCSHALSGARFRAPRPKDKSAPGSSYASLVAWVSTLATDCGWVVEREMLRIPSTRNTALIGRSRNLPFSEVDVISVLEMHGGAAGWEDNASKLLKSKLRGH